MSARDINAEFQTLHSALQLALNGVPFAPSEVTDDAPDQSMMVEGVYMRAYTAFENAIEELFIHYACGGPSTTGFIPVSRLANCSSDEARAIIRGDGRYIDWSSPAVIRDRAARFFVGGEPFHSEVNGVSALLAETERIRNRIAHDSLEAKVGMRTVEIARFLTARTFVMRAGQLLRARRRARPPMSIASEHMAMFAGLIQRLATAS